jgi:hypothetical protein
MAGCASYNCTEDLAAQVLNDCGEKIEGGIPEMIIFDCGHEPTDPSDETEVASIIAAGNAVHVKQIKGGIAKGSPQKPDSMVSGQPAKVSIYEFTGAFVDGNVNLTSDAFYRSINSANGRVIGSILAATTGDPAIAYYINPPRGIVFEGSTVIPNDTDGFTHYDFEFMYKAKELGVLVAAPTGIFGN